MLPLFISQIIELLISMKRIQDFLLCDNINPTIVQKLDVKGYIL